MKLEQFNDVEYMLILVDFVIVVHCMVLFINALILTMVSSTIIDETNRTVHGFRCMSQCLKGYFFP